jgi:hypothetical protein
MRSTYKLATVHLHHVAPFGPLMTLAQAQAFQSDMVKAGCSVVVVNIEAV